MSTGLKIILEPQVAFDLESMVSAAGRQEFSGFGWVRREGQDFVVYDYEILNVGSETYTEIQPDELLALLDRPDRDRLRVWLHRHPLGSGLPGPWNWSATDNHTIQTVPLGGIPELVKWSLSIVRTPKGWVGRIDNHLKGTTAHVPVYPQVRAGLLEKVESLYGAYLRSRPAIFFPDYPTTPEEADQLAFFDEQTQAGLAEEAAGEGGLIHLGDLPRALAGRLKRGLTFLGGRLFDSPELDYTRSRPLTPAEEQELLLEGDGDDDDDEAWAAEYLPRRRLH